ncbi:MAG: peroxide stress protein YaaA [Cyclobacteriaceae bacterium]|nr:peroxide stress protein YaaA [Cyclobacteriaceae bacterium]
MLVLISPAKSFDPKAFGPESPSAHTFTKPIFKEEPARLIKKMGTFSKKKIEELMHISPELAALNVGRYQKWLAEPTKDTTTAALLAFNGEVYRGLNAKELTSEELDFAQAHLRILSGLYGVLRPLDLMQAYRLEMGTKLQLNTYKNLYQFWGDKITKQLNNDLGEGKYVINLASAEYYKSINQAKLKAKVITPVFKDYNKGKYKIVAIYAKNARGRMSNYIIKNRITEPDLLKSFDSNGYAFEPTQSGESNWVFLRG